MVVLTLMIAAAAIWSAWIFQGQLTQAQKQFEVADRPWISVDVSVFSPLAYDSNGIHMTFKIVPKNIGHSPAQSIWIQPTLVIATMGDDLRTVEERTCQQAIAENQASEVPWAKYTLFPGDSYVQNTGVGVPIESINSKWERFDLIPIALVGCVDYIFGPASRHHQTGFIYEVLMRDGRIPSKSKAPIAPELLGLRPMGGQFAN